MGIRGYAGWQLAEQIWRQEMKRITIDDVLTAQTKFPSFKLCRGWGNRRSGCLVTLLTIAKGGRTYSEYHWNGYNGIYTEYVAKTLNLSYPYIVGLTGGWDMRDGDTIPEMYDLKSVIYGMEDAIMIKREVGLKK